MCRPRMTDLIINVVIIVMYSTTSQSTKRQFCTLSIHYSCAAYTRSTFLVPMNFNIRNGWFKHNLIRSPNIHVGGLRFYHGFFLSFFHFSFFFRCLISELAERTSAKIGHMLGSNCGLKMHVQNLGYPLPPTNRETKNHLFGRLCNLTASSATLTAYVFRIKHDIDNRSSALTTTSSRNVMNFGPQMDSNWTAIFTQPM